MPKLGCVSGPSSSHYANRQLAVRIVLEMENSREKTISHEIKGNQPSEDESTQLRDRHPHDSRMHRTDRAILHPWHAENIAHSGVDKVLNLKAPAQRHYSGVDRSHRRRNNSGGCPGGCLADLVQNFKQLERARHMPSSSRSKLLKVPSNVVVEDGAG